MKPRPLIHRTNIVRIHGSPGEAISLDEYIETERADMTASRLRQLLSFRPQILAKMEMDQALQHHDLREGTEQLLRILVSREVQGCSDPLPPHLAEAGAAIDYLLKGIDLIPDCIPEIGLTDDARLVARVFARNAGLWRINPPLSNPEEQP